MSHWTNSLGLKRVKLQIMDYSMRHVNGLIKRAHLPQTINYRYHHHGHTHRAPSKWETHWNCQYTWACQRALSSAKNRGPHELQSESRPAHARNICLWTLPKEESMTRITTKNNRKREPIHRTRPQTECFHAPQRYHQHHASSFHLHNSASTIGSGPGQLHCSSKTRFTCWKCC